MTDRPPTEELIRLLHQYDLKVGELALELRALILREAPSATERIFKSYVLALSYSLTDRWMDGFCHIAVYSKHVNLGFNRGAELEDPEGLLIGSGKIIRHITIERPQDFRKPHVRSFVRAAIKHSKSILAKSILDKKPVTRPSKAAKPNAKVRRAK